jgi:formylmethanofuran dehydrogenase subunit D
MAKQLINVGSVINDGTGDAIRTGAQKINDNFTELYNALGGSTGAPLAIVSKINAGSGINVSSAYGEVLVSAKTASAIEVGSVKVGTGLNITEDGTLSAPIYSLPKAASNILGGIKVGARLSIDSQGVLSADPGAYTLPTATSNTLGGVKVGAGLTIVNGILSVSNQYVLPTASGSTLGGVKIGARLTMTDGVLSADVQSIGQTPTLTASDKTVTLGTDGRLRLPSEGVYISDNYVGTVAVGENTTIYSTNGQYVRAIKMFVFAEKIVNGYESQACEVIGTIDESENIIYTSTYGLVYTGNAPLFTISNDYDLLTQTFIITASPTGADDISIRTQVTEMYGTQP